MSDRLSQTTHNPTSLESMHLKIEILSTITSGTEAAYWLKQITTKDPETRVTLTVSHDDGTPKFLMTASAKMILDFIKETSIE